MFVTSTGMQNFNHEENVSLSNFGALKTYDIDSPCSEDVLFEYVADQLTSTGELH